MTDNRYQPVFVVNDWGVDGWFVGTRRDKQTASITFEARHSLHLVGPCRADVRWPDGTEERVKVEREWGSFTVGDMGHHYDVRTPRFYIARVVCGAHVKVSARTVMIDPTSVVFEEGA